MNPLVLSPVATSDYLTEKAEFCNMNSCLTDGLEALWLPQAHNPRDIKAPSVRDTNEKCTPHKSESQIY